MRGLRTVARACTARLSKRLTQESMLAAEAMVGTWVVVPPLEMPLSRLVKPVSLISPRRVEISKLDRKLLALPSTEKVVGAPHPLMSLPILMSEPTSPELKV